VTVKVCPAIVNVPVRCEIVVFAATLYGTLPFPVPLVAPVSVIHAAFVVADHVQPLPTVTVTLPVAPPEAADTLVGAMPGAHGAWKVKPFDVLLGVVPPGPTEITRASRLTPVGGAACSSGMKSTRMMPPTGVGLPRSTVSIGVEPPDV
jgi:hypothetical protein